MPDGQTHHHYWNKIRRPLTLACAIGFVSGLFYWNAYPAEFFFWVFVHYMSGRYIDPDLDLEGVTASEGRMGRELDFFGLIWRWWWMLYALLLGYIIKRLNIPGAIGGTHRTWLSHSLVPGTIIRMIFANIPFFFMINLVSDFLPGSIEIARLDLIIYYLAQFSGLGLADIIHLTLDKKHGG